MAAGKQTLPSPGAWEGQAAWIVGGGPSLKGFDWDRLRVVPHLIAVNMAFIDLPWADFMFTEDFRLLERVHDSEEYREAWDDFSGRKVFNALSPTFHDQALALFPDLVILDRKRSDKYWSESWEDGLALTSNSALGAVNFVDILGARTIYLLGIDCSGEHGRNFHDRYPEQGEWRVGKHQYTSYKSDWEGWAAPNLKRRGKRAVNVINPESPSALTCFETKTLREVFV